MRGQEKIGSGSGFLSKQLLITCNHVIKVPYGSTGIDILLRFDNEDPASKKDELRYSYDEFMKYLVTGSYEESCDYAVFNIPVIKTMNRFNFEIGNPKDKAVGDDILFLGYPLEHNNLVCHKGTISSFYKTGTVSIIQLDASINQSNSGGPLIDPDTGNVLGIITRKATGLTKLFTQFMEVFDKNIEAVKPSIGGVVLAGVDPIAAFMCSQIQMKKLGEEILRSANVGIGYAFSIEHLSNDLAFANFPK